MTSPGAGSQPGQQGTTSRTELIVPEPAEAMAGLLDIDTPSCDEGLPALWHWVYLLERRRQSDLGKDGHPTRGIPAPPAPGRLRMFAGGRVSMERPLRFGVSATRTTRVSSISHKVGRSGPLTFVTVRDEIEQAGHLAIVDEKDIVYRPAGSKLQSQEAVVERDQVQAFHELGHLEMTVDPLVLFRFSALTYNAHRIHYDAAYAAEEGYPGLVVHGPLQALLMGECLRRTGVPLLGKQFSYRMTAPTYGPQYLVTRTRMRYGQVSAQVRDGQGHQTATAVLESLH